MTDFMIWLIFISAGFVVWFLCGFWAIKLNEYAFKGQWKSFSDATRGAPSGYVAFFMILGPFFVVGSVFLCALELMSKKDSG